MVHYHNDMTRGRTAVYFSQQHRYRVKQRDAAAHYSVYIRRTYNTNHIYNIMPAYTHIHNVPYTSLMGPIVIAETIRGSRSGQ